MVVVVVLNGAAQLCALQWGGGQKAAAPPLSSKPYVCGLSQKAKVVCQFNNLRAQKDGEERRGKEGRSGQTGSLLEFRFQRGEKILDK